MRYTLLIGLLLWQGVLVAQPLETASDLDNVRKELVALEKAIDTAGNSVQAYRQLSKHRKRLTSIRGTARDCIMESSDRAETLKQRLETLGEKIPAEDAAVAGLRRELDADINAFEKRRAVCDQVVQVSSDLLDRILSREQAALKARLFARGSSTSKLAVDALSEPLAWSRLIAGFLDEGSGWDRLTTWQRWAVLTVIVLLTAAGFVWQRRWLFRHRQEGRVRYFVNASPWLLASLGSVIMLVSYLPVWPPAVITRLALGILAWLIIDILLRVWLYGRRAAGLAGKDADALLRWLRILAGLVIAGGLLATAEAVFKLPDPHYFLLRTVMAWLLFVGVILSAVLLGRAPGLAGTRTLRVLLILAVLAIAVAETLGFRNLSMYLLLGFGGTSAGFGFFDLVARSFVFLFDGLDEGRYQWQKSLRQRMELETHETVPGLVWLRIAAWLLIWSAYAVWVLWVWGQSERWLGQLIEYFTQGFNIGSLHIAPLQVLGAIAVLAAGITLTRWIKQRVIPDLVRRTRLDRGGREAIITVSGYLGVTISLLIALGIAGISYTNLAIVAGALSVGIGFGLQNVVNNFVSGLILLFERPIRTGDWVVVGDTQGYVRKISIRSTQIETFDRADVIVPNSELIANKVANWMLRDPWGRIIIPVGVAYGSDVQKVQEILLEIANKHEGILKDQPGVTPPKALFRRFGDSALEFELRCFIRQIDRVFDITHDLNIAIDRSFREAGITIPFPQRDIHVKALPKGNVSGST